MWEGLGLLQCVVLIWHEEKEMGMMMGWKILVRITPNPIITPLQIRSHSQLFSDHTLTNKQLIIQCVFTYLAPSLCW